MANEEGKKGTKGPWDELLASYTSHPRIEEWLMKVPPDFRNLAFKLSLSLSNLPIEDKPHAILAQWLLDHEPIIYNPSNNYVEIFNFATGVYEWNEDNSYIIDVALRKIEQALPKDKDDNEAIIYYLLIKRGREMKRRYTIHDFVVHRTSFKPLITRSLIANIIENLKAPGAERYQSLKRGMYIAFANGLYLDVEEWATKGTLTVYPYSPEFYVYHRVNVPLNLELFREVMKEAGMALHTSNFKLTDLMEKFASFYYKAYRDWVVEDKYIELLLEWGGYVYYLDYPLQYGLILIGEGSNGKSLFLNLIKRQLGDRNITAITMQEIANNRFAASNLYRKMANLVPDMPKEPIKDTGIIKALLGEDTITADRKFLPRITFKNYAKFMARANELPSVADLSYAWLRRWQIVEFPNKFPQNPDFENQVLNNPQIDALVVLELVALRRIMAVKRFAVEREVSYEFWVYKSDTVYAFIHEMLKEGVLREEANGAVKRDELYSLYVKWCYEKGVEPVAKQAFTSRMESYGYDRVKINGVYHYRGLILVKGKGDLYEQAG